MILRNARCNDENRALILKYYEFPFPLLKRDFLQKLIRSPGQEVPCLPRNSSDSLPTPRSTVHLQKLIVAQHAIQFSVESQTSTRSKEPVTGSSL